MNPYQDRVTCSVCGGPGVALAGEGVRAWFGGEFHHQDPRVCASNLKRQRRELEKERAQIRDAQAV
jgi:hypothetical protein